MSKANVWTYTKEDTRKVRIFAENNNLARFDRSIADFRNADTHDHVMSTYVGNKNNLRVIAAYAYALEQIARNSDYTLYSFVDFTDIF